LGVHLTVREHPGGPLRKQGQCGRAVQLLEARLAERGLLAGKPDGTFDAKTAEAVRRFERRNQLAVDGIADNAVWLALGGAGEGSGPTLKQGARGDGVKVLQRLLAKGGHYDGPVDGDFGPMTAGAVKAFERKHGLTADGVAGQEVWRALGRHVVQNPVTAPADAKEPAHDYRRVSYSGGLMNMRTKIMLQRAEKYAAKMGVRVPFTVVQGSFSHHVSASGGTHDGGGALDLRTWDRSVSDVQKIVKALRMAGFAAWKRGYGGDSFDKHIHAIAIGDRQMSSAARSQVAEYFRGGDGLVGSAPDGDRSVGRPWPKWANRYR
ncbi:MAG: peptidoglycan-binding domain-containing protein, partial [Myxococcales bacterium]